MTKREGSTKSRVRRVVSSVTEVAKRVATKVRRRSPKLEAAGATDETAKTPRTKASRAPGKTAHTTPSVAKAATAARMARKPADEVPQKTRKTAGSSARTDREVTSAPRTVRRVRMPQMSRAKHVDSDIPLEVIAETYTPAQTSGRGGFRDDGHDRSPDVELASFVEGRFSEEDAFTNKSGDPRIGTHRRPHAPAENEREEAR